jgi:uncharacterized protein
MRDQLEELPMLKPVTTLAAASAMMLPAAAFAAPQVNLAPTGPVVELSIYESIEAAPDRVTIGAGVTTTAPTATAAMQQNAAEMTKVIARIKALGIPEKDIQTIGVALGPQYDYEAGGPVFRGYQAANRVSVNLAKIEDTGRVLDALVEAGATDISGPNFAIADDTALKENIEGSVPLYVAAKVVALEATATPIQPGQIATGVSITITYELVGTAAAGTM